MGIKIYNGYKVKPLTVLELKEFSFEIKKRLKDVYLDKLISLVWSISVNTIQQTLLIDEEFKETQNVDMMKEYLEKMYNLNIINVNTLIKNSIITSKPID